MAVLVVLAPDVELFLDRRNPLVVVLGARVPIGGAQQAPLFCRLGPPAGPIPAVGLRPEADQSRPRHGTQRSRAAARRADENERRRKQRPDGSLGLLLHTGAVRRSEAMENGSLRRSITARGAGLAGSPSPGPPRSCRRAAARPEDLPRTAAARRVPWCARAARPKCQDRRRPSAGARRWPS